MIKCAECGYENLDGLDYCDGCGAKLAAAGQTAAAESVPAASAAVTPAPAESQAAGSAMGSTVESASGMQAAEIAASEGAASQSPGSEGVTSEGATSRAPTGELKPAPSATPPPPAAAAGAPFKAKLTLTRGSDRKGHEFELEPGKNFIGRWDPDTGSFPEVDLEQDDPEAKISRKHAVIIIENGKITLDDIGSLNGTFLNRGQRLVPGTPVELHNGDEIIIGKTFLQLTVSPIS